MDKNVVISTTIPIDIYREIKEKHIPFNSLILMGLQAWKGNPAIIDRQRELETLVEKLQKANVRLQTMILDIQRD